MALDPRFICSSDLESVFLDKLTGLALSGGTVNFYIDGTNTPKAVYTTTGSPPSGFIPLGDSVTLNVAGGYQDSLGNPVALYYFPYHCTVDGDPTTSTGVLELYEAQVFNSGSQLQFTREAWPPLARNLAPTNANNDVKNFIPNGQFLFYNANPITDTDSVNNILEIAQGGWSFRQTTGSTGSYTISFVPLINGNGALPEFPPNGVRIQCNSFGNETIHDLFIKWPNVNTFSKNAAVDKTPNTFTFSFEAILNSGIESDFNAYVVSNFGTGGDVYQAISLIKIVSNSYTRFNLTVTMPDNTGNTATSGNYVALALRTPNNQTCDVTFTDFSFIIGTQTPTTFPVQTNAEMLMEGIAGWMPTPNPDGSSLYLPLVLTQTGMTFDSSVIGTVYGKWQNAPNPAANELMLDGASYLFSGKSAIGISYSRLGNFLLAASPGYTIGSGIMPSNTIPLFGTGPNFVSVWLDTNPAKFNLNMNTTAGGNSANAQTSGFSLSSADPLYVFTVTSVPTAGTYFSFTCATGGSKTYNVWFSVNGSGSAPLTPTGANIQVKLVTGDTVTTTMSKIQIAVNQYQFMLIDARGYFWRGLDTTGTIDPDAGTRTIPGISLNGIVATGAVLGSLEAQAFLSHNHTPASVSISTAGGTTQSLIGPGSAPDGAGSHSVGLSPAGGSETRPVNLALFWYIRY